MQSTQGEGEMMCHIWCRNYGNLQLRTLTASRVHYQTLVLYQNIYI